MAINGNDLLRRVCAGAVYIGITGGCTVLSWHTTLIVFAVTSGVCCYEFLRMARNQGHHPYVACGTVAATLIPLAMAVNIDGVHVVAAGLAVAFVAAIVALFRFFIHEEDSIVDVSLTIFGYLYTGLTLSAFVLLRSQVEGLQGGILCLLVLLSVWMNDAFAYLGGSAFGRHKFAPKISPKKTWEGVVCGMLGSVLFWLLIPVMVPECGFGLAWAALAGVLCGVAGIIGDLTESHIKRSFKVKDSGDLMPGHGGLLDRSDSLLFVSVVACCMVIITPEVFTYLGFAL